MKKLILSICLLFALSSMAQQPIDRKKVVERNNPHVTTMDSLNSLSVGNGGFAMTVDGTGLQSFPKSYSLGVPLGTMSDWGWHFLPILRIINQRKAGVIMILAEAVRNLMPHR